MRKAVPFLISLVLLAPPALTAATQREGFQPLDLFDLGWVADPQISPDGSRIVYVRMGFDIMADRPTTALWIIGADGNGHEPLTGPGDHAAAPRWSPDGERLAYVAASDGAPQIHVRWLGSGRDIAITHVTQAPGSLTWSPDGARIAFVQFVPKEVEPIAKPITAPEGAEWSAEPHVYQDSFYRSDGEGFLRAGRSQIFLVSAAGGQPIQLTRDDFPHDSRLSWSSDGAWIYFASNYHENWQIDQAESDIHAVNVESGEIVQVTDRKGGEFAPAVSPDGKWLAYLVGDDGSHYEDTRLFVLDLATRAPRQVLTLDLPVSDLKWAADSKSIYFGYQERSVSKVGRVDLGGAPRPQEKFREVATGLGGDDIGRPYSSGSFTVSRRGSIAHDLVSLVQPANLAITVSGKQRRLTDLNADFVHYRDISAPEEIWFPSPKGNVEVEGWIVKPPGFDPLKKYPLILEIHGGPNLSYCASFAAEIQLYAAAGYVVLYMNPRGSTSYGGSFARAIDQNFPGPDYDDLMAGVDAVVALGYVDPSELFVTGGSGGGILTAWIVTQTDRFRAAVSQKPVINWFTHTLTADIGPFFWRYWFARLPWQDPSTYLAKSPIGRVDKVTTPTMLITAEEDWRTPMSEAEQFYQALGMNGVETALVRIQDSSHHIAARPANLLRKVAYVLGWFDRYRETGAGDEE